MEYKELRQLCIRYWNFHPETKGSIDELWAEINKHSCWKRTIAEPSAILLFGELARFCDKHAAPAAPEAGSEQIAGTTASARPEERPPQWTAVGYVDREGVARWELGRGPADHPHGTLLYVVKRPDMNSGLPKEKP